jgi:hypothetical protein
MFEREIVAGTTLTIISARRSHQGVEVEVA